MAQPCPLRPAILGPIHLDGLRQHLSGKFQDAPLPAGMGGYCVNALIEARLRRGWKTDVITIDTNVSHDITRIEGPLLRIWVVRRRAAKALRHLFDAERRLMMKAVNEAEPDLLHAHWTYEYGLTAARQSQYPYVLTVHDHALHCMRWLGWKYGILYLITRHVLRRSRHLTAVSPYVGDYLERTLRRPVQVIPNVLPEFAWKQGLTGRGAQPGSRPVGKTARVVSALNWSDLKNVRGGLQAFRMARQLCVEHAIDLEYTLMGAGLGSGGPAECWARGRNCAQGVTFKGLVTHEEALREIAGADVLFHPSHEEAMPGPVCEAMAMRVPVVACREAGGCRWLCGEDRGLLCDGYDPRNMAERIVEASLRPQPSRCKAAHSWLAGVASDDQVLEAFGVVYEKTYGGWTSHDRCQS